MPTYSYRCRDCGHELDVHQGFADSSLTECPVCGGSLRKQYGTVGVTFNGSGFYRTDSRAAAEKSSAAKSESGSGDAKPASSGGGDAKPAAKESPAPAKPAPTSAPAS